MQLRLYTWIEKCDKCIDLNVDVIQARIFESVLVIIFYLMTSLRKWTLGQITINCVCCGSKINAVKFLASKAKVMDNVSKSKYSDTLNLPKTTLPFRIETKKRTETDSFIYEVNNEIYDNFQLRSKSE